MYKHPGIYDSDTLSDSIKSTMRLKKITQKSLGEKLNRHRKTINRNINNLDDMPFGTLIKLCKELGIQAIIIK